MLGKTSESVLTFNFFSTFASALVMRAKGVDKNLYFLLQRAAFKTVAGLKFVRALSQASLERHCIVRCFP